ncbi:MAG: iron-containing alcohol dehydrogenase [Verrucomicrobiota bacterium]|nr:iron-containing alcohol dehydrogenase [Verrucomicrobiota bacterium]
MKTLPEELMLPARTIARPGAVTRLLPEAAAFGRRGLLVHGRSLHRSGAIRRVLDGAPRGLAVERWECPGGEPTLDQAEELLAFARSRQVEWVAAVGGGSVLDAAKACAGLLHATGPVLGYHDGKALPPSRTPFLAAPATAGTGSECTGVCVLTNAKTLVKKSFRHSSFMARVALLDAELLATCPPAVIAASGMDAFTQAIESYVSRGASWFSDAAALEGIARINGSLEAVFREAKGDPAQDLMTGSYLAGLALANARLGIAHGLAHPLGARRHVPHGLACAVCLPHAIEFNRAAMGEKYDRLSRAVGGDLLERTRSLIQSLGIESPFAGKPIERLEAVIEETLASGSTTANPRPVGRDDVLELLRRIFDRGTAGLGN